MCEQSGGIQWNRPSGLPLHSVVSSTQLSPRKHTVSYGTTIPRTLSSCKSRCVYDTSIPFEALLERPRHFVEPRTIDNTSKKRGLFIGRFQPFHRGHLSVIEEMIDRVEYLIIAIGSAKKSYTATDPFTAGERTLMIKNSLKRSWHDRCFILQLDDINRYNVWVSHVEDLVPPFDLVIGNSTLTALLFSEKGYEIFYPEKYSRDVYRGRVIRQMMLEGDEWTKLVPPEVVDVIRGINGPERIKKISGR